MNILTAKSAGFCFGVKRAVDMAFKAAERGTGVFTLGPIIHNPQVISKLSGKGVVPIESIDDEAIRTLIIRTHGVPGSVSEQLAKKNFELIDATCPFVKKAQQYAKLLREDGYQVVILGDSEHPEVKALMSYAGSGVIVVNQGKSLPRLRSRVGIVVQTTHPVSVLREFVAEIIDKIKELKVFNTICNSTAVRLRETKTVAQRADVMIVVGGRNSANTTQLARLCESMGIPTHHIETSSEISDAWFAKVSNVGITAGASTPDWIIREVESRIRGIGGNG